MSYVSILLLLTIFFINISSIDLFVSAQIIQDHNKNESKNYIPQIYPTQSGENNIDLINPILMI